MDSQTKVNVEFKPAKRMKKRRELDALVNGGKQGGPLGAAAAFRSSGGGGGRGTSLRNGKHELLRNDSDSSEVEEFILPEKSLVRKRGTSPFCSICVTVCWGVLLVICLVGIGGLVWMCIQLKKDVDQLRIQLDKVGMLNSNIPGQVRDVVSEQEKLIGRISQLESGEQGIEKLRENFTILFKQLFELEATTKSLNQSVANAPQLLTLQSLPLQLKELSKSVADLGSNLQTMKQDVIQLQEAKDQTDHQLSDIEARLQSLQLTTNEQRSAEDKADGNYALSSNDIAKLNGLVKDIMLMNVTFYTNLEELRTKYNSQQTSMLDLYNYTTLLNTRVTFLELRPTSQPLSQNDLTAVITTSVQTMFEEIRNYSRDQDLVIQQNKVQSDSLIALLQAQITGQELKISVLTDELKKVNVSVTNMENMTYLNIESLNSKVRLLEKELKPTVNIGHSDSYEVEGKPQNMDKLSSASSSSSFAPSSSVVTSSPVAVVGENQTSGSINNPVTNGSSSIK